MRIVNVREARKHLSQLLDDAERGASVVIERHGRKVARLGPANEGGRRKLPDLSAFRAGIKVTGTPTSERVIKDRDEERA